MMVDGNYQRAQQQLILGGFPLETITSAMKFHRC